MMMNGGLSEVARIAEAMMAPVGSSNAVLPMMMTLGGPHDVVDLKLDPNEDPAGATIGSTMGGLFVCERANCKKTFSTQSSLRDHERYHRLVKRFTCVVPGCNSQFAHESHMIMHMRKHTGEKPFKCTHEGCGRAFSQMSNLRTHQAVHSGIKPFVCAFPGCNASFSQKIRLITHARVHSSVRPFRCNVNNCQADFARKASLMRHIATVHNLSGNVNILPADTGSLGPPPLSVPPPQLHTPQLMHPLQPHQQQTLAQAHQLHHHHHHLIATHPQQHPHPQQQQQSQQQQQQQQLHQHQQKQQQQQQQQQQPHHMHHHPIMMPYGGAMPNMFDTGAPQDQYSSMPLLLAPLKPASYDDGGSGYDLKPSMVAPHGHHPHALPPGYPLDPRLLFFDPSAPSQPSSSAPSHPKKSNSIPSINELLSAPGFTPFQHIQNNNKFNNQQHFDFPFNPHGN